MMVPDPTPFEGADDPVFSVHMIFLLSALVSLLLSAGRKLVLSAVGIFVLSARVSWF